MMITPSGFQCHLTWVLTTIFTELKEWDTSSFSSRYHSQVKTESPILKATNTSKKLKTQMEWYLNSYIRRPKIATMSLPKATYRLEANLSKSQWPFCRNTKIYPETNMNYKDTPYNQDIFLKNKVGDSYIIIWRQVRQPQISEEYETIIKTNSNRMEGSWINLTRSCGP